jgi:fructose-1,6-bisphosphatase I
MIAGGYIIYGSSTMLVYATKRGVNGFTLDPSIGEFTLSHPDIRCPEDGNIYSVNQGNFFLFPEPVKKYIESLQRKSTFEDGPYKLRYTGSLVADLHRNMLKGGIFLYPGTPANPEGKLRLVYECNPFAFILSIAGGMATDSSQNILDIKPESLHQRTPFFAGSKIMMEEL